MASLLAAAGCKREGEREQTARGPETPSQKYGTPETTREPTQAQTSAVTVKEVEVGSAVGSDKKITDEKSSFRPDETVYVSVETDGTAPQATLTARFNYEGDQLVKEQSATIVPSGAVATEFHVAKPGGFPEGNYQVKILLDGNEVASKDFKVEAG